MMVELGKSPVRSNNVAWDVLGSGRVMRILYRLLQAAGHAADNMMSLSFDTEVGDSPSERR